ncbi:MAG: diaminopimelate decarboxylase [Clostridiales bacterium]|nr:diaminopimelate decarboxylase [Candidatus Scatonaster coprocaballi]
MESYTQQMNFFGKTNPEELLAKYGSPLYVYNEDILRRQMRRVAGILVNHRFTSNFSIKTNSNLSILRMANEEGLNADAMSPGEIYVLKKAGFPSERIFYVPNNVSEEEMQYAIDEGVMLSVDSLSQLEMFGRLCPGGRLSVRLNPGVGAGHHEKVVTAGEKTKFGVAAQDIEKINDVAKKYDLHVVGLNQHIGSLFMDYQPYLDAVTNFLHYAEDFPELEFVDFGGGFGVPYHKLEGESEFDLEAFKKALDQLLTEWKNRTGRDLLFKMEPGRYTVAEGGVLLGCVHAVKENYGHKYVGTDIGMNVLIRPELYDSYHDVEIYRDGKPVLDGTKEIYSVVGNICETGDIVAKDRELPITQEGDVAVVLDAGAYGFSMSSNYNNRLRPAEVLIDHDGNDRLIRRRDTFEDLVRGFDI